MYWRRARINKQNIQTSEKFVFRCEAIIILIIIVEKYQFPQKINKAVRLVAMNA